MGHFDCVRWNLLAMFLLASLGLVIAGSSQQVPNFLKLVLPDTYINPNSIFADERVFNSRMGQTVRGAPEELRTYVTWAFPTARQSIGRSKVDVLESMNAIFKDYVTENKTGLPSDYLFFGPESLQRIGESTLMDVREVISILLRTNAFYVSALSGTSDNKVAIESNSKTNWFGRIIRATNATYHRVDATFDDNLYISSFQCYTIDSQRLPIYYNCTELQAYQILSVLLNYYSQCIHANLHIFQYIMGSGLAHAADISLATNAFATPYMLSLQRTYTDVVNLDLQKGGVLVGGLFSAERDEILQVLRDVLSAWGSYSSASDFVNKFLFGGFKTQACPLRLNLLEEFQKHVALYNPFAKAVNDFMSQNSRYQLSQVNRRLKDYFKGVGTGLSKVPSLKVWLELMSATGLMHGQTLSFTRYMCTKVSFVDWSPSDNFESMDATYYRATSPTIVGAQKNRQQFQSTIFSSESVWYDPLLGDVLAPFLQQAEGLKAQYLEKIIDKEGQDYLKTYGWLIADFFPEGWDGRQLTLTTYF